MRARPATTGEIFTHGGRKPTGINAVAFAKLAESKGAGEILLTSMDKDGTKSGFDLPLTQGGDGRGLNSSHRERRRWLRGRSCTRCA